MMAQKLGYLFANKKSDLIRVANPTTNNTILDN
jgi:hypothetical protein